MTPYSPPPGTPDDLCPMAVSTLDISWMWKRTSRAGFFTELGVLSVPIQVVTCITASLLSMAE
jgi:hypothetical protein